MSPVALTNPGWQGTARVAGLWCDLVGWREARRRRAANLRELMALDDHMLADIGVTRAATRSIARQGIDGVR